MSLSDDFADDVLRRELQKMSAEALMGDAFAAGAGGPIIVYGGTLEPENKSSRTMPIFLVRVFLLSFCART